MSEPFVGYVPEEIRQEARAELEAAQAELDRALAGVMDNHNLYMLHQLKTVAMVLKDNIRVILPKGNDEC